MNSLFGVELPVAVNFVIAFVVVLALIGAATWLIRRFGATRLDAAARGRQPRLAVIDQAAVDGRRKLVIVRRDNVEHLLMIGGPNDVVVETAIVRGAAMRETPRTAAEVLGRPVGLPDPAAWSEPAPAPAPAVRVERARLVADDQWQNGDQVPTAPAETPAPPVRGTRAAEALAGLAAELSRPEQPRARPVRPVPVAPAAAPPAPPAAAPAAIDPNADKNLAEMAQRLEAALRQPGAGPQPADKAVPRPDAVRPAPKVVPRTEPTAAPRPAAPTPAPTPPAAQAAPQPAPGAKTADNLEQEMASLLGRSGKT